MVYDFMDWNCYEWNSEGDRESKYVIREAECS